MSSTDKEETFNTEGKIMSDKKDSDIEVNEKSARKVERTHTSRSTNRSDKRENKEKVSRRRTNSDKTRNRSDSKSRSDTRDTKTKRNTVKKAQSKEINNDDKEFETVGNNFDKFDDLPESINDFEDMSFLSMELFKGVHEYGFKHPSPIQSKTIHIINSGCDLIAQSQSGTGKTGAFTIGSLTVVDPKKQYPQVIMIANTRTLACQIAKVVESISYHMKIDVCLCVGGNKVNPYVNMQEAKHSHVLVGTPGRLGDLLSKGAFDGNKIKTLIMDESDVLLKEDFKDQIIEIIKRMGERTQICIFSATFSKDTLSMTENFLRNPYRVTVEKEKLSLDRVKQYCVNIGYDRNKFVTLEDLYQQLCISQMIIFVNSIRSAEILRNRLMDAGFEAGLVHGKMNNVDRENVLKEFRLSNIKTLISTDVMCRGIDIDDLRIVINYDMASDPETYIHRVGRSGRYGGQGVAINFCTYDDMYKIKVLERDYNIEIPGMPHPNEINEYLTGIQLPNDKVLSSKNYN